jgi:AraC-like DNA-binding protein
MPSSSALRVISMRSVTAPPSSSCEWHGHPFEELCLSADDATCTGAGDERIPTAPNTLFYYPRHVLHGYWNGPSQAPRFWVLHFLAAEELHEEVPFLRERRRAVLPLAPAQVAGFRHAFMKLFLEHTQRRRLAEQAEAAWLRLLLVEVQRWSDARDERADALLPGPVNPDLLRMWQLINESVSKPGGLTSRLEASFANYDSLRHAFKAAFGSSPKQMLLQLRLQQAKNLLLDTPLSIKEIAAQVGYEQQHEFARGFRKMTGVSPSSFRAFPLAREGGATPRPAAAREGDADGRGRSGPRAPAG